MNTGIITIPEQYSLVICEKPAAAQRISQAIGTSDLKKIYTVDIDNKKVLKVPFPIFTATDKNGKNFVVCSALGHLYGLVDNIGNRSTFPIFEVKWMPIIKKADGVNLSAFNQSIDKSIKAISALSRKASGFIHACDFDQEGEVIGYNILEYACNNKYKESFRAKFSTLTDDEIRNSFNNLIKPNKRLADAGLSRHMIDFIYGVNLSRALTQAFKVSNDGKKYYNLSIGRVQGPTLAFVVDREIEIRNHISMPYWTITAEFDKDGREIKAYYYPSRIDDLSKATSVVDACKNQDGRIDEVKIQKIIVKPPHPFNLGDLQKEAYRTLKFSPSYTLALAEKLYLSALISYPRTSSQKLPSSINYKKILSGISNIDSSLIIKNNGNDKPYSSFAKILLSKDQLVPNDGSKDDPAHPAIYPTGEIKRYKVGIPELKLYDLIVHRFFSTFGDPAINQHTDVTILIKDKYIFKTEGKRILYEGWIYFYKKYIEKYHVAEIALPTLNNNDILKNKDISMVKKFTQPPSRFNQSSLLQEMEREKIGTKATRAEIINTLFKRNYIVNKIESSETQEKQGQKSKAGTGTGIAPTDIGFEIVQSMRRYIPDIVSTELTRSMEEQLEKIESDKVKSDIVIDYAKNKLKETIVFFKENQKEIGNQISNAVLSTNNLQQVILGSCPVCKGNLIIKKSNKTKKRFVGCSNYSTSKCNATAPLPQKGIIKSTGKTCSECKWPFIETIFYAQEKRKWQFCINVLCPSKRNGK